MRRSAGFTLLELLIGMTLLGFILALLFGGFRLAANSWNAVEERGERAADDQTGRALVRRLVAYAQPLHWVRQAEQPLAFAGAPESLRLVTPLADHIGPRVVELAIEPAEPGDPRGGARRLVLRHGPMAFTGEDFAAGLAGQAGETLLAGLAEAGFSYFGPEKRGAPSQWLDHWPNPERFPQLVRLRIAPVKGTPLVLDMAPMANGDRLANTRITAGPQ